MSLKLIFLYQSTLAHFFGGHCRFYPSCSHYAVEAFQKHSFFKAMYFVIIRFFSCHPLSKRNFYDPVPYKLNEMS